METSSRQALPARLSLGDTVALLAPASWAEDDWIGSDGATTHRLGLASAARGALEGIVGVAVGTLEGFDDYRDRGWGVLDVLRDRLGLLGVPILAGLPLGHDPDPVTVPLGVRCELDADAGTLRCAQALD